MSDTTIDLGKKLIDELGMATSQDTLARWLAHHIAGLIKAAECAPVKAKRSMEAETRAAILDLLTHVQRLPEPASKLQTENEIMRALERLSPETVETDGYFASFNANPDGSESDEQVLEFLKAARIHDQLSRRFIRLCLRAAAERALDRDAQWIAEVDKVSSWDHQAVSNIRLVALDAEKKSTEDETRKGTSHLSAKHAALLCDIAHVRKVCDVLEAKAALDSQTESVEEE